ncbi:hypothetical protein I6H67_05055 [Pediococcus pentosaceus]|uniref:hypothetical protein n=1 Tax=Pediococcus pentosaceus TaxID=1255 RepID=UPI0018E19A83|nr:hypothetical protein I6H67_05055 [Pediococcus pentosaceus]
MMANGKVSAQDMMSFVNVFPKIRTELLKTEQKISGNHNLSMKQLNDMISKGEVSSKTMQKLWMVCRRNTRMRLLTLVRLSTE